jgi:hypothetical protein
MASPVFIDLKNVYQCGDSAELGFAYANRRRRIVIGVRSQGDKKPLELCLGLLQARLRPPAC